MHVSFLLTTSTLFFKKVPHKMTLLPICERLRAQLAQGWVLPAHAVHTTPHAAASAPPARSACYQLTSVGNEEYTACAADGAYALRLWVRRLRGQQRYLLLTFESDGKGARIPESSIKTRRLPATEATARARSSTRRSTGCVRRTRACTWRGTCSGTWRASTCCVAKKSRV